MEDHCRGRMGNDAYKEKQNNGVLLALPKVLHNDVLVTCTLYAGSCWYTYYCTLRGNVSFRMGQNLIQITRFSINFIDFCLSNSFIVSSKKNLPYSMLLFNLLYPCPTSNPQSKGFAISQTIHLYPYEVH